MELVESTGSTQPAKSVANGKDKPTYTVFDLRTLVQIINQRGTRGVGIKDVRMIDSALKKIRAAIPEEPVRPEIRKLDGKDDKHTPEELTEFNTKMDEYVKAMGIWVDQPLPDFSFTDLDLVIVKNRFKAFDGFFTDDGVRDQVIALADKLGV